MTIMFIFVTSIACAVFLTLVGAVIYVVKKLRARHRRYSDYLTPVPLAKSHINVDKLTKNLFYHNQLSSSESIPTRLDALEFPRNEIVFLEDIGKGSYGKVFKAKTNAFTRGRFEETLVAVKMLCEGSFEYSENCFKREANLMCELDHPNIVKMMGVCLRQRPMYLIYEYMSQGKLTDFLRQHSPQYFKITDDSIRNDTGHVRQLNGIEQLDIAIQIASAMLYLSSKGFVHRDLASTSCLVSDHLIVKISDMASCLPSKDEGYGFGSNHHLRPVSTVRWMAPEAIFSNNFSWSSDVWSFGVVLWEIFSFAMEPYYELASDEAVITYIKSRGTLKIPQNTCEVIYQVMKECWNYEANERPKFSTLYQNLRSLRRQYSNNKYTTMHCDEGQHHC